MLVSFFIAAGLVLLLMILRAYSSAEDTARHVAKALREDLQAENPGHAIADLDEDGFINYFEWLRRRRFWLYMGCFFVIAATSSTLFLIMLGVLKAVADPGPWLWGFIAIFVLTAGWTGSMAATLYLYRTRRDASLLKNLKAWPDAK